LPPPTSTATSRSNKPHRAVPPSSCRNKEVFDSGQSGPVSARRAQDIAYHYSRPQYAPSRPSRTSPSTTTSATIFYGEWLDPSMTYSSAVFTSRRPVAWRKAQRGQVPSASPNMAGVPGPATSVLENRVRLGVASPRLRRPDYECRGPRHPRLVAPSSSASPAEAHAPAGPRQPRDPRVSRTTADTQGGVSTHIASIEMIEAVRARGPLAVLLQDRA